MGNSACCEEEAKAGDFGQVKPKFQPNKIHIEPHKLSTVDFNAQPGNVKTVFMEPRPQSRKEGHKEERSREAERADSEEDQLPIISNPHIESRYKEGSHFSHLLNTGPHKEEQPEEKVQVEPEQAQSSHAEQEGEKAENKLQEEHHHKHQAEKTELLAPKLTEPVESTLHAERFFHEQFSSSPEYKRYDNEFYEGQLDKNSKFPDGLGKLYKHDHSLYVGHFSKGKAEGQGAFIFPDGSYYFGEFRDNFADGKGSYKSNQFSYEGQFKRNRFHGKGKEVGKAHEFSGQFYNGSKTYGKLSWKQRNDQYEYFGSFNNGQFNGEGTLKEPTGTYKGEFINGRKHGYGVYNFANGLRFEGEYRDGVRQGKGALYNPNNRLAYEGDFERGMPHGEGCILDPTGKKLKTKWVEGIDSTYL